MRGQAWVVVLEEVDPHWVALSGHQTKTPAGEGWSFVRLATSGYGPEAQSPRSRGGTRKIYRRVYDACALVPERWPPYITAAVRLPPYPSPPRQDTMAPMRSILFALTLVLALTGCGISRATDKVTGAIVDTKTEYLGSNGKVKPISELKRDLENAVRDRDVLDVKIGVLTKSVAAEELAQRRHWLIAISVLSFLGSLICLGIMLAWPNPALVTLERIGVFVFGVVGGGAWFASMLLPYLTWIFGGICLLIGFFVVRYMLTGRKLAAATQVSSNLVDLIEERVIAPLTVAASHENTEMLGRLEALKQHAKAEQLAGGFWQQTEALRMSYDASHAAAQPTPVLVPKV